MGVQTRRRHPRVAPLPEQPVMVDINGDNFLDVVRVRDISEGGAGIFVPHDFRQCQLNELVRVVITLPAPNKASFSASGRIRHKASHYFGVQFLDLRESDRQLIRRYVTVRLRSEGRQRMKQRWAAFWAGLLGRRAPRP